MSEKKKKLLGLATSLLVLSLFQSTSSLRTADAFLVVASLPPKNIVSEPERQNDFLDKKPFVLMLANQIKGQNTARVTHRELVFKFSSTGERAPGYRLSPDHFQKFKRMPAPDWAQKMLCIIVPNRRTASPEFFL